MKTSKKKAIITAVILMVAGIMISVLTFAVSDFHFSDMDNLKYETNEYNIDESFSNIIVDADTCDVNIIPADNRRCTVVCNESDKIYYNVSVKDNTLKIEEKNKLAWYDYIGFLHWGDMSINIYLPEYEYNSLYIENSSGNVDVSNYICFFDAEVNASSGDINFEGYVVNDLEISASSGNILLTGVEAENIAASTSSGDIRAVALKAYNRFYTSASSGDITVKDSKSDYFRGSVTSGDISLTDYICDYDINLESTSGDLELEDSDAKNIELKATSGDITGKLLSAKLFDVDTNSGDVDVPQSAKGGRCRIETTSGDIEFEVSGDSNGF